MFSRLSALASTACVSLICLSAAPAQAIDLTDKDTETLTQFFHDRLSSITTFPVLIRVLRAQNVETEGYAQKDIDELEKIWEQEMADGEGYLVSNVLENAGASFLYSQVADFGGIISEINVTDALGLNAAASMPSQDYWQGDEPKFQEAFGTDPNALHIGDVDYNPITHLTEVQLSAPVWDGQKDAAIGVITISIVGDVLLVD